MVILVSDPISEERIKCERGENDRDEVWDGVLVMSPLANNEHQAIAGGFFLAFSLTLGSRRAGRVFPGCNVSDRDEGWIENYRIPDVAVFLPENSARDLGHHWLGGPDLAVEVLSFQDRARDKIAFYAQVGVRELLIVDRDPWAIELYRMSEGSLTLAARVTLEVPTPIRLGVLPLSIQLVPGEDQPSIEVAHETDGRRWSI